VKPKKGMDGPDKIKALYTKYVPQSTTNKNSDKSESSNVNKKMFSLNPSHLKDQDSGLK